MGPSRWRTAGRCPTIAYGFMASKALFAALSVDLFTHVEADGARTAELAAGTGVAGTGCRRCCTRWPLWACLAADGGYRNAPACRRYLVRGGPATSVTTSGCRSTGRSTRRWCTWTTGWPAPARRLRHPRRAAGRARAGPPFIEAQHAGSRAAAQVLAGRTWSWPTRARCSTSAAAAGRSRSRCANATRRLRATVLDFPAVIDVAREYRSAAAVGDRIELRAGDAVHAAWPPDQDVVLLSYLLSALGGGRARHRAGQGRGTACRPGGLLVVHDFMLDDDRPGPALAALWFLQYVAYRGDAVASPPRSWASRLQAHGFLTAELPLPHPGHHEGAGHRRHAMTADSTTWPSA